MHLSWTPTHSEAFFSLLVTSVDSHAFATHLILTLAEQVRALSDFMYAGESSVRVFRERLPRLRGMDVLPLTWFPFILSGS